MPSRLRKLIGLPIILGFLAVYVIVIQLIGLRVPDHWAIRLAYFAIAGTFWGVPLFPLIAWMQRGK